jgi:hypothetical protein
LRVVRGGQPFCADEDRPRLDPHGAELFCGHPRVVGEAPVDLGFASCVHDQEHANVPLLGSGERTAKEHELLVCERVHEGCVLGH